MCPGSSNDTKMAGSGLLDLRNSFPSSNDATEFTTTMPVIAASVPFAQTSYTKILEQMSRLYPYDPAAVAASLSAMRYSLPPIQTIKNDSPSSLPSNLTKASGLSFGVKREREDDQPTNKALDLSTQNMNSVQSSYHRIPLDKVKPKIVEDLWVENDIKLVWTDSKIAAYNPAQKLFMCMDCECVGFLSRVAEHWLGAHANLRVFHCPRCPYTSAWSRCVKMHLTRQHTEQFADTTMWKENATLLEVTQLMQDLRTKVETKIDANNLLADKRFYCPHCPYATDRRDLYTRHENIHKDNKPFHCYLCFKQFNRADHVKKHFVRMHADTEYDISKIRKNQNSKNQNRTSSEVAIKSNPPPASKPQINEGVSHIESKPAVPLLIERDPKPASPVLVQNSTSPTLPISRTPVIKPSLAQKATVVIQENISPRLAVSNSLMPADISSKPKRRGDKAYTCHYCNWSGSDNWCLKRHMNTHIKPFGCIMCDYKAARAERLSTHVWKVHNKRVCNKCNFLADTQEKLLEHTREEHHNNPYSRRHICSSCGMSFDTRANFETHIHLTHARPKSPVDVAQITPVFLSPSCQDVAQDLTLKSAPEVPCVEEQMSLICPIEDCSLPFTSSGSLADHVRQNHGGLFASRCPHCGYNLTQDELSKDHWLTHHEDVCCACVHVFTSVYGPQLWKKVHARPRSEDSPLNAIVNGLNKKRSQPPSPSSPTRYFYDSDPEMLTKVECEIRVDSPPIDPVGSPYQEPPSGRYFSPSPSPEDENYEMEKSFKRQRKQSCPKKVITVHSTPAEGDEEESDVTRCHEGRTVAKVKISKRLKYKRCLKCPHKPVFSSYRKLKIHRLKRHRNLPKLIIKKMSLAHF